MRASPRVGAPTHPKPGAELLFSAEVPFGPTHVSGTNCYPCLRSGQGPTRVVGRTRTMFHNTLVVDSSIRKPGKSSKTAKRPAICMGVRPGELVGHQPCSITLWWLVRVRPAPPPSHLCLGPLTLATEKID